MPGGLGGFPEAGAPTVVVGVTGLLGVDGLESEELSFADGFDVGGLPGAGGGGAEADPADDVLLRGLTAPPPLEFSFFIELSLSSPFSIGDTGPFLWTAGLTES
jgi:hypothetical protein